MLIRVNLEIGHEASLRTKRTPEGFTHDWEVFVRGCDGADIHHYVEKVVFYLHDTFPKPKRVVKKSPYTVKESGYAGFTLPIEIYLKNVDEPKVIRFEYDLHLQNTGPAIIKVQKEKYVFHSPSDEFKYKLLKGGGVVVNSNVSESSENRVAAEEKNQMINKPKLSGADASKKHKMKTEEPRVSNSFQELFGTPITKMSNKLSEPKLVPKDTNKIATKVDKVVEKDKVKSKHSPHKDKERDKEKTKEKGDSEKKSKEEKKKEKDRTKERERSKEKTSKREKSPKPCSPSPKRSPKRASSPKRPPSPPPKHKEKEEKRVESSGKDKDKKSEEKSEKKSRKEKRDKDKEHKENKHKEKDKSSDYKEKKESRTTKDVKEAESSKVEKKEKTKEREIKEPIKEVKDIDSSDKTEKVRSERSEEKQKHKHKKKDKERKEKKEEKERSHKSEKKSDILNVPRKSDVKEPPKEIDKNDLFESPKREPSVEVKKEKSVKPLNALFSELSHDSSSSSFSSREPSPAEVVKVETKKEPVFEPKKPKLEVEKTKIKKEKVKKVKDKKGDKEEKRKRKSNSTHNDEGPPAKIAKEDSNSNPSDAEKSTAPKEVDKENQEDPEDYMRILKDLQHKIMTLQDNSELQKVVQLILDTGRYEVSARTFDFDLCLLERSTIRQLQEFFSSTS